MKEIYEEVSKLLDNIDFDKIWKGYKRYDFALYNDEMVYLNGKEFPKDDHFRANTTIEFEGRYIATWYLENEDDIDIEVLAAYMVHEMFHAFQMSNEEERFSDDLAMLAEQNNLAECLNLKYQENQKLVKAVQESDLSKKQSLLKEFMQIRKFRQQIAGPAIMEEFRAETIEGMAEFAGCMALRQISKEKYTARINGYLEILQKRDEGLFDTRKRAYETGTLLCVALRELEEGGIKVDFYHEVGKEEKTLFEFVSQKVEPISEMKDLPDYFSQLCQGERDEKQKKIDEFLKNKTKTVEGNFRIVGYDPMNMIRVGNQLLCTHFVALKDESDGNCETIFESTLLLLKDGANREAAKVIRKA